jgi:hypothetical protein
VADDLGALLLGEGLLAEEELGDALEGVGSGQA